MFCHCSFVMCTACYLVLTERLKKKKPNDFILVTQNMDQKANNIAGQNTVIRNYQYYNMCTIITRNNIVHQFVGNYS